MKTKLLLAVCLAAATLFSGCKKDDDDSPSNNTGGTGGTNSPTANFTVSNGGCQAPCNVTFNNTSTNATSFQWDFGDGNTSTQSSPSHTYTSGGNYSVQLTVNSANTKTQSVSIGNAPTSCTITYVSILSCPLVNGSGVGWDAISAPDFYIYCNPGIDATSSYYVDESNFPQSWTTNWTIPSSSFGTTYSMQIWEHDSPDADDYVSAASFKLSDYTTVSNHYPSNFTITSGASTQIKIYVTWN